MYCAGKNEEENFTLEKKRAIASDHCSGHSDDPSVPMIISRLIKMTKNPEYKGETLVFAGK
jgi:hypothetical protein